MLINTLIIIVNLFITGRNRRRRRVENIKNETNQLRGKNIIANISGFRLMQLSFSLNIAIYMDSS